MCIGERRSMIDMPPALPPSEEQVIEQRLIECGLNAKGLSVKYEAHLQSIEIVIRPNAGANVDRFKCIKDASGYEIVTFEDRNMHVAYNEYASELARSQVLDGFKASLEEKGLLEAFPERRKFQNLREYAKALETHGGLKPGTALRVSGDVIVFDPPHNDKNPADFMERYSNLLAIVGYASALERLNFGFIGNAAVSEK
ncbi:hypothetical protein CP98_00863 [Sphingobium yanoikuyae]|uniref:Uncharacterized protein n=2 Tax=Sphingobium yanoikuyae TaxID=13690 RepID=A0A084ES80_SPHYA|nr:hypothetical protein CP98_00863 [Sphingobium yanoikuyae]